ncbi:hypothetical protein FOZ63_010525, partial [Perkinsus olseni]
PYSWEPEKTAAELLLQQMAAQQRSLVEHREKIAWLTVSHHRTQLCDPFFRLVFGEPQITTTASITSLVSEELRPRLRIDENTSSIYRGSVWVRSAPSVNLMSKKGQAMLLLYFHRHNHAKISKDARWLRDITWIIQACLWSITVAAVDVVVLEIVGVMYELSALKQT